MAMWAMTTLVAPVMGPLLGGWITDNISWPWIFYINIPVGIVAALASLGDLPQARKRRRASCRSTRWAWRCWCSGSARCRSCWTWARSTTGSTRGRSSTLAVIAAGRLRVLPDLGADRRASGGRPAPVRAAQLLGRHARPPSVAYGLFFGNVVLLPLWLQQFMGYTATDAGMMHGAGGPAGDRAVADRGQDASAKVDPRRYATFAFLVFALVLWMRSRFNIAGRLLRPS